MFLEEGGGSKRGPGSSWAILEVMGIVWGRAKLHFIMKCLLVAFGKLESIFHGLSKLLMSHSKSSPPRSIILLSSLQF